MRERCVSNRLPGPEAQPIVKDRSPWPVLLGQSYIDLLLLSRFSDLSHGPGKV